MFWAAQLAWELRSLVVETAVKCALRKDTFWIWVNVGPSIGLRYRLVAVQPKYSPDVHTSIRITDLLLATR